jgi:FeS assembly protein IscX
MRCKVFSETGARNLNLHLPTKTLYKAETMADFNLPISWDDTEDIAMALYERFGDDFGESKIYRIRFTDLHKWVLEIPSFTGKPNESTESKLEMIQTAWVYEWRNAQKKK